MSNKLASNNKNKKKENQSLEIARVLLEYVVMALGIALCVLVPLYLKDGYHGVGDCKYELYKWIMIIGCVVVAFACVLYFCQGGPAADRTMHTGCSLCPTDYFVFAFLFFTLLSALVGGNFTDCIAGYKGWYMGIVSMFSFALLYFMFARAGRYYKAVLYALLGTSFITYIVGVLHRMMIDVIGTYYLGTEQELADGYKNQFLSTLGQSSWYSSFVCTVFPLGLAIFWCARKKYLRILSGIFTAVGSMTLVTQNSDSAYMAMLGFFFVLFWFSAADAGRMERFMETVVLFLASTRVMYLLLLLHPNPSLSLDALSYFMVYSKWMSAALVLAVVLWGLSVLAVKKQKYPAKIMKAVRLILLILIVLALLLAVVILSLSAKNALPAGLLAVTEKIPYMTWSDKWGNGRGQTWSFSIRMYRDMDIWHKLFGVGSDGYAPYAYSLYAERLAEMWGNRTLTNAHNEWMNALITFGLFGCISYIGIFVSACVTFAKKQKDQPVLVGFMACVVSYMCHNAFCYQTVCCTPFIFILMGIGIYISTNYHLHSDMDM